MDYNMVELGKIVGKTHERPTNNFKIVLKLFEIFKGLFG
jgi:hypothetical protein